MKKQQNEPWVINFLRLNSAKAQCTCRGWRRGIAVAAVVLVQVVAARAAVPWVPVYATDFTSDPGWTTTDAGAYHWNSGSKDYTLTMVDASGSYATIPITLAPHQSFKFEFDVKISRMDWAGDINVGLLGVTRDAYPDVGPHPYLNINFANGDLGNGLGLQGFDGSGAYWNINQYPSSWALNTNYHAAATYDHDAGTLTLQLTRKSDGLVVCSNSVVGVQDFEGLVSLGASKITDVYAPGATGIATIDNVSLSQPAWIPVYTTDFTTNPGWTMTDAGAYHWNSGSSNYTLTMVDASGSYATTPVLLTPHVSLKFEFDVNISRMDWAGDINVGLLGVTRDAYPDAGPHPYVNINFANGDLGNGVGLQGFDGSGAYWNINQYPSSWAANTPYHATATYDHDVGTLTLQVRRRSDSLVICSNSIAGVRDFANLVYVGASKIADTYAPGATGVATIDNVGVYESAPAASMRCSQVEICWPSRTNAAYNVQYSSSLSTNLWVSLFTNVVGGAGQTCVQDAIPVGSPQRFYRVQMAN